MKEQQIPATMQLRPAVPLAAIIVLIGLIAAGCATQAVAGSGAGDAVAQEGRRLFQQNCTACHGENGDRVPVAPLNAKEFLESRGDATLVATISEGRGVMPAWGRARGGPFTAEQIHAVVAYLNVLAGRTSHSLLAGAGRAVFQQQCVRCHGEKGDRIPVAPLTAKAFMDFRTDAELLEVIGDGKGLMPAFRATSRPILTEEQVRAVVSYLRFNAEASLADQARRGRELYLSSCLSCHGERGDRVPNIALAAADYLRKLGDGAIVAAIADGKGGMPGFTRSKGGAFEVGDVGALLVYLKSWAGLPAGSALAGPEMPSQGRDLYVRNCTGCHGESGDKVAGIRLKSREYLDARSDDALLREISQGNARGMPAWGQASGGPLAESDIQNILKYLRSLAGSAVPAGGSAPSAGTAAGGAAAARGKELFTKNCTACHGDSRDKIPTAKLADRSWLQQRGNAALAESIANGKGAMPGWAKEKGGTLGKEDIAALLAYLKSAAGAGETPATSAGPATAAGGAALTGEAARGKELFAKSCTACHGDTRDKMPTAKLAEGSWLQQRGDAALTQSITNGKGGMPAFGKEKGGQLAEEDVTAVLAYLKAAAGVGPAPAPGGNPPPAGGTAPAATPTGHALSLQAARGKEIFTRSCTACHGDSRDKIASAKLAEAAWLQQQGDATLSQSIANGKGGMPGWSSNRGGPLSQEDIAAVLAYLKAAAGAGSAPSSGDGSPAPAAPLSGEAAARGMELYTTNCAACHGDGRDKVATAKLADAAWLQQRGDAALSQSIATGKGAMPGWAKERGGPLSQDDITALLAYLKSAAGIR